MSGPVSLPASDLDAAPAPAAVDDAARRARSALLRAWIPAVAVLVLLDVTFNSWFWRIPKLTPRSADYGYQFLLDARAAAAPPAPGTRQVLALGSSVAVAFDPDQVQSLLRAQGAAAEVHRLLLPGVKPSDLRLYFDTDGAALHPDVAVLLLNPLDFLNPSFERDLKPQVRTVLPPAETLRERGAFISTVAGKLDLAVAALSNLYRYRKPLRSALEDHLRWAWRWLRGGGSAQGFGWYADGYTAPRFAVPLSGDRVSLEYFVDPAWLAQRGAVQLVFSTEAGELTRRTHTTPGWQRLDLPRPAGSGPLLSVAADGGWSPRAAGADDVRLLGVRLRAVPTASGRGRPPLHYPPAEREAVDTLLRMGASQGDEFAARWQTLLDGETEFGRRFRAYRDSKLAARDTPISPDGEYGELERLVRHLSAGGAQVVLINAPESALLRDQYAGGAYYQSYRRFLADLAARTANATFVDLGAALPPEDFNDWHHTNYIGSLALGPRYAELLRPRLSPAPAAR
ncbi:MAG: hypothetical protein SF182_06735 [Deltaproteobacteria bacterium]|nr:hypothetical protein [Deltaproteobacteria bacterium]